MVVKLKCYVGKYEERSAHRNMRVMIVSSIAPAASSQSLHLSQQGLSGHQSDIVSSESEKPLQQVPVFIVFLMSLQ